MAGFARVSVFAAVASTIVQVDANAFLHKLDTDMESVSTQAVEQTLMTELALLGRDEHLMQLQNDLRPMYEALPKNAEGKLDAAVVRYALHRFFVQSRGWFVQGLQPSGELRNASASVKIMKDRVPGFIQDILDRRVLGQGLGLDELAAFAATIQDLVHAESVQHLRKVFEIMSLPTSGELSEAQVEELVDAYLMHYIIGGEISPVYLSNMQKNVKDVYPAWPDVAMWARDLRHTLVHEKTRVTPFPQVRSGFDEAAQIVREAGHRFGAFQDQECRTMKDALVELEYRGTGRVRLSEFYKNGLEGNWQFGESLEYLRAMGALDESNPSMPSVLIANYVGSQSNCLASSSFYSVCCLDECENLMGRLEVAVGEPTADPGQIATLLAGMSSDTVDAPRNLSSSVLSRLNDIADHHGGRVPLHGRLFAQLMHHAYPRECPYPHVAGTTNPMTPDEWMAQNGSLVATESSMRMHISAGQNVSHVLADGDLEALPWTHVEELVALHEPTSEDAGPVQRAVAFVAKLGLLAAMAGVVAPSAYGGMTKWRELHQAESKLPRYLV